jgi:predicted TIM-barrel fold metal-dependent hydrolase
MIVDSHVHVWSDDDLRYPTARPGKQDPGSVEFLVETMATAAVEKAVIVQPIFYLFDTRYVADSMRRSPGKFAGIALMDQLAPGAPDRLQQLVEEHGFSGIRLHFPLHSDNPQALAGKDQNPLWQRAQDLGLGFIAFGNCGNLPIVEKMVRQFPGVKVVVDHVAHPDVTEKPPYPLFSNLLRLARYPNAFVKISNLSTASRQSYPYPDTFPFVRMLCDAFGPQRLMWGSDFPLVFKKYPTYLACLENARTHLDFLTEEDKNWLLGNTAASVWTFPSPAT